METTNNTLGVILTTITIGGVWLAVMYGTYAAIVL